MGNGGLREFRVVLHAVDQQCARADFWKLERELGVRPT